MPIKDNQSITDVLMVASNIVTVSATDFTSTPLDTHDFANGVTFIPFWHFITGVGPFTLNVTAIQDSEDGISDWQTVPDNQLVARDLAVFADVPQYSPAISADVIATLGVVGTRRYVRAVYDVTVNGGDEVLVNILVNAGPEIKRGES